MKKESKRKKRVPDGERKPKDQASPLIEEVNATEETVEDKMNQTEGKYIETEP